ncbi:MAG: hypothetical protein RLZZ227_185 [Pseudomonadota bacterium]|jgi:hypothetical protein
MKSKYIAMVMASALFTVGLTPLGSAQEAFGAAQAGIEVITVVGKRPTQEGIEVITVVGKRAAPTVASTCVNEVMADRARSKLAGAEFVAAQALASHRANRQSVRLAIRSCIDAAQMPAAQS